MRKMLLIAILLVPGLLLAQTAATTKKTPTTHTATHQAAPATPATHAAVEPKAVFETTAGKITCTLFKDKAPITVENFIGLATGKKEWKNPVTGVKKVNSPMYDGTIFHRVIPNFMIQGGDPAGNGSGEIGFTIPDEFRSDLQFDIPGRLAMANTGRPHTGAGQFFITVAPTPWLNGKHTIFGQCEPPTVIDKIVNQPRDPSNDKPFNPIRISHVQIVQAGGAAAPAHKPASPAHKAAPAHKPAPKK